MKPLSFLLMLLLAWRMSGANAQNYNLISSEASDVPLTVPVEYSCVFRNLWTSARHPAAYPSSAHWSPMVLVAHSEDYTMWEEGQLASLGVENVAEVGSTSSIRGEINAAGSATNPAVTGPLFFVQDSEGEVQLPDFQIDETHPFVSAITMIAPSSDWFSGFSDFQAIDVLANAWYQEFEVETFPWDAGTADDNFASEETNMPIFVYSIDRLPSSGAFASADRNTVLTVARWTCTLQAPPPAPSAVPSVSPSREPSMIPSNGPSVFPSILPSESPSDSPSESPSESPSLLTSETPSDTTSLSPSQSPSDSPSESPSGAPSLQPSESPSLSPSKSPSASPSKAPSLAPSESPSSAPSESPTESPSESPSVSPSGSPSASPWESPSGAPTGSPSVLPSGLPSDIPVSDAPVDSANLSRATSGAFCTLPLHTALLVVAGASFFVDLW